jgi:hypothetical protein
MPSTEPLIPDWVPCQHCGKDFAMHIDRHCPFDSTEFGPDDKTVLATLYAVRRRFASPEETYSFRRHNSLAARAKSYYIFQLEIATGPLLWAETMKLKDPGP